jgi:hypothetical protein
MISLENMEHLTKIQVEEWEECNWWITCIMPDIHQPLVRKLLYPALNSTTSYLDGCLTASLLVLLTFV